MALLTENFRATNKTTHAISGVFTGTVKKGTFVRIKSDAAAGDPITLELAADTAGFCLTRDVVSEADYEAAVLKNSQFGNTLPDFMTPFKSGGEVSAVRLLSGEFEGDALDASVDNTVSVGDAITFKAGKPGLVAGAEEVVGHIRSILPKGDAANDVRVYIEFLQP